MAVESLLAEPRTLVALLRRVLKPIAAFCLRRGLVLNDFIEGAKGAFLDAALAQLRDSGKKENASRVAAMTGLHRIDIKRLTHSSAEPVATSGSVIRRVITTWAHSEKYADGPEQPRALTFGKPDSQFSRLCSDISTSIHPSAVLFELERTRRVQRIAGKLALVKTIFQAGADEGKAFELLARDLDTVIQGVLQNIEGNMGTRNAHFSTQFSQIGVRHVPEVRNWIVQRAGDFHRELRLYLAALDRTLNPELDSDKDGYARVNVSTGSFVSLPAPTQSMHSRGDPE